MIYYIEFSLWSVEEPEIEHWQKSHLMGGILNYANHDRLLEYIEGHISYWVGGSIGCLCCTRL